MLKVSNWRIWTCDDVELHDLCTFGIDHDLELHTAWSCRITVCTSAHFVLKFRYRLVGLGGWRQDEWFTNVFLIPISLMPWNPGLADNTPVTKGLVLSCGLASLLVGTQGGVRVFSLSYQVLVSGPSIMYVWFVMFCRCCRQNWSLISGIIWVLWHNLSCHCPLKNPLNCHRRLIASCSKLHVEKSYWNWTDSVALVLLCRISLLLWHLACGRGVAESCTEAATLAPGYGTICILIHTGAPVWSLFIVLLQSLWKTNWVQQIHGMTSWVFLSLFGSPWLYCFMNEELCDIVLEEYAICLCYWLDDMWDDVLCE